MAYNDMREWIAKLESEGDLKRIAARVDWNLELGQITRKAIKEHAPALLFENIKDHDKTRGRKLLANSLATRARMAMSIGLPGTATSQEITQVLRQRFKGCIPPVTVKTGPVKENVMKGSDVDLTQFPVPKWHPLDGGRYINTMCGIVTRDPDDGTVNVGLYRGMVNGKNKINCLLVPHQHWGQHFMKYQARKQPMPVAIAYGWDDVLPMVAGTTFAHPPYEWEIMGAVRQKAVELVKCETNDLEVPATAEIVVEGHVPTDPATFEMEGPYGEWTGYYGWSRKRPVIHVDCITHRNDPIFRGQVTGQKVGGISEAGIMAFHAYGAVIWNYLEAAGIPGILDVVALPTTMVKIHKLYEGQARQIAAAIWGSWYAPQYAKNVIVVDDDVNIRSLRDVELAIRNRVDPKDQVIIYPGSIGCNLDPSIVLEDRDEQVYGGGIQNRMLIDATIDWRKFPIRKEYGNQRFPPQCGEATPEIIKLVDQRWKEYGF